MNAPAMKVLVWKMIKDNGAATQDELTARALQDGAKAKTVEGQMVGVLRLLENQELITEDIDSKGHRFWKISKNGEKEVRKAERKVNSPEHGDMYEVETVIRLTLPSLSGSIPAESTEDGRLEWPREDGRIVLYPVWFKGMFRKVFERVGNVDRFVADWLMFDPVMLDADEKTRLIKIPVPPDRKGGSGKGVNVFEALSAGTTITVRGVFPGRVISRDQIETLWRHAGRVGFSVGKSKLGFGTFEVLQCTVLETLSLTSSQGAAD